LAFDASGILYAANAGANTISKITSGGGVTTFVNAGLTSPQGAVFDTNGNLYVANTTTISKVASGGGVTTFVAAIAGASLEGLAFDTNGNL
jgi:DNA-binding beta-propeller fold protein YncE